MKKSETLDGYISHAVRKLTEAAVPEPNREARYLMEQAGLSRLQQISYPKQIISADIAEKFMEFLQRRCVREPLSHIIGIKEFWSLPFITGPDVLDPRPETECLIEMLLEEKTDRDSPLLFTDLGTGSGCLLITALKEYPRSYGIGCDYSNRAIRIAQQNADNHQMNERASLVVSDWGSSLQMQAIDVILSNPPYIEENAVLPPEVAHYDPPQALYGGKDGLQCYRALMPDIQRLLRPNGLAIIEIGFGQRIAIEKIAKDAGLYLSKMKCDLSGIERALLFRKQS